MASKLRRAAKQWEAINMKPKGISIIAGKSKLVAQRQLKLQDLQERVRKPVNYHFTKEYNWKNYRNNKWLEKGTVWTRKITCQNREERLDSESWNLENQLGFQLPYKKAHQSRKSAIKAAPKHWWEWKNWDFNNHRKKQASYSGSAEVTRCVGRSK